MRAILIGGANHPLLVLIAGCELTVAMWPGDRHDLCPPVHHPVRLGEEPMPSDVDTIAVMPNGAGNPSDALARFQNNRVDG
jgi:hypothetical protein